MSRLDVLLADLTLLRKGLTPEEIVILEDPMSSPEQRLKAKAKAKAGE